MTSLSARAARVRLACLAVSWILVSNFIPFANLLTRTPFSALQAHLFFGALLLLALLLSRPPSDGDPFVIGTEPG